MRHPRRVLLVVGRVSPDTAANQKRRDLEIPPYISPRAPLCQVHEHPYRTIYLASADALHVVTLVHFKQQLDA